MPAPRGGRDKNDVFVGNIPYGTTEEQLHQIFSVAGGVVNIRLVSDHETGKPKGYAFVEYEDASTALSSIRNLNGYECNGRQLRVNFSNNSSLGAEQQRGEKAPQQERTVKGVVLQMSIHEVYDVVSNMKQLVEKEPDKAKQMFVSHPQVAEALLHMQVRLGMLKADDVPLLQKSPPPAVVGGAVVLGRGAQLPLLVPSPAPAQPPAPAPPVNHPPFQPPPALGQASAPTPTPAAVAVAAPAPTLSGQQALGWGVGHTSKMGSAMTSQMHYQQQHQHQEQQQQQHHHQQQQQQQQQQVIPPPPPPLPLIQQQQQQNRQSIQSQNTWGNPVGRDLHAVVPQSQPLAAEQTERPLHQQDQGVYKSAAPRIESKPRDPREARDASRGPRDPRNRFNRS